MISIIICSRTTDISFEQKENIKTTIGTHPDGSVVTYELIVIDNSNKQYSICQAYNKGVSLAKGEYLCFVHDDVLFRSQNWGESIIMTFNDSSVGMIGIAGTHFLPKAPCGWWSVNKKSQNIIQGMTIDGKYVTKRVVEDSFKDKTDKLVSADGVFLCFRKDIFERIKWDEEYLKGFHGYDTDISLQVLKIGLDIKMDWDILLEHKSYGCGDSFLFRESCKILLEKWRNFLPQIRGIEISNEEILDKTKILELQDTIYEIKKSKEYTLGVVFYHPDQLRMAIRRRFKKLLCAHN